MRIIALVCLLACGKAKQDESGNHKSEGPDRISNHELATSALTTYTGKAGPHAFTIDLPIAELNTPEIDAERGYTTWETKRRWTDTPTFTVQFFDTPLSPDDKGPTEPFGDDAKDRVIARSEKLPDGGYVHLDQRKDHAFFALDVCHPLAGGKICCDVIQRSDKPLAGFDEIVSFAEKVCKTMKAT